MIQSHFKPIISTILLFSLMFPGCNSADQAEAQSSEQPRWNELNERLIEEHNVAVRTRDDIPNINIQSNLGEGQVINITRIPSIRLAEGVEAKAYWGSGNLMSFIHFEPNASIPEETIEGERFLFVLRGEVEELVDGEYVVLKAVEREEPSGVSGMMPRKEFLYLEDGASTLIRAGADGARILVIHGPVPPAYLERSGAFATHSEMDINGFPLPPNVEPGVIHDLYDFQYTELVPGANARLISGKSMQMSFLRMDPDIEFAYHLHPEEQVMIGMRGWIDEFILADTVRMKAGDMLNLPAMMVHGGKLGPYGSDALDVFYPPRTDYWAMMEGRMEGYHAIIPEGAKPELLVDGAVSGPGLNFTEGPAWLNGKLYFSNMYFDAAFGGDPARSSVVEMDPDGTYRYILSGEMQSNGVIPTPDGTLIVADMFGNRVVEMTTGGEVTGVLADSFNGTAIDGPNDLVMDRRGGIYFTDPQFTPDAVKNQPGRTVYYRNPEGEVIRLLPYDDFAMPNGVILSPDENTLYINNTYDNEEWWNVDSDKDHFVWAYDVNDDGTISNGRPFGQLHLTGDVLDRMARSSGADGMAVDTNGNLYVATYAGVQIFNSDGVFQGMVNLPVVPVNVTFGGDDMSTLYITAYDKIYQIETNQRGFQHGN
ncbi:MAG: SMP-30/gluconolactonase/LRE family protein [Balneolaceae bacterium]